MRIDADIAFIPYLNQYKRRKKHTTCWLTLQRCQITHVTGIREPATAADSHAAATAAAATAAAAAAAADSDVAAAVAAS